MSHRTSATVIADSIGPHGPETRLTSIYVVFPKMVLAERNRHRGFSLSDRSSRAVPPEKLIQEVRDDPAVPARFRYRTRGMGGGDDLPELEGTRARSTWMTIAKRTAEGAAELLVQGLAKEIVNRPLDPFVRMHSLMTGTRDVWLNFIGLRLDEGADPTILVLAKHCYEALKASKPRRLRPGEWHLPFIEEEVTGLPGKSSDLEVTRMIRLSAARCAHLSYNDLETGQRMTIERGLAIYDKLIESRPIHASPAEHQATPEWGYPTHQSNLYGWLQARKMLPGEAVAPLPAGHEMI